MRDLWTDGMGWSRRITTVICLFFVMAACNVDDGAVVRPGEGNEDTGEVREDAGDLDVGQPDADLDSAQPDGGQPDGGQPDADVEPAPSCDDGVQNGDESAVDCGGACAPCALGESCGEATDCESGFCTGNVCVDESCADVACADDEACYRAVCYLACEDADGCDPNSRCYQGACVPLDCSTAECTETETCYRGVCYGACTGDESCSEEGAECVEGSCVVPTCDDGLQNGEETDIDCGGSECDACAPGKMCEIGEDCQEPLATPWSDCDFGESTCAEVGTQTRTVTTYSCGDAMTCEVNEAVETQECTRQTDDVACGETVIGEWGACQGAGEQGVCTTEGERRRVITSYVCAEGGCDVIEEEEFEACVLDTDAQACGAPETGAWSECGGFDSVCDQEGTRSRTVTYFECAGGDCNERVDTETESCLRATTGTTCGDETYGAWSACEGFSGVCGRTGTQSRTVTYRECNGGECSTRTATESQTCTRETNGTECQADAIGNWSSCSYADQCSNIGSRTRTITEYACQGGSCASTSRTETDSRTCDRSTDGNSCGTISEGAWSSCDYRDECATSGTRSRTVTYRECNGGECSTRTATETDTSGCSRVTNGQSCGEGETTTSWSACGGFSNSCDITGTQSREVTTRTCAGARCESRTETETRTCERASTDGNICGGGTSHSGWGACRIAVGSCSGSQVRTRTDRSCVNQSCTSTDSLESRSCNAAVGASCDTLLPADTTECREDGYIYRTSYSGQCNSSGNCAAVPTTVRTELRCIISECSADRDCGPGSCCNRGQCGPCLQVCEPYVSCTNVNGDQGCCNADGTQCVVPANPDQPVACISPI